MTSDVLAAIDRTLDGLCPCGAPPREGSIYCGPDCEPTHISIHTDQRQSGDYATPMRWRPDLVSEVDDRDLLPLGSTTFYEGRYHAQVFERVSAPETWHLRLDDGHRFIGVDLDNVGGRQDPISVELVGRVREAWRRLERELTDPAHAVPNGVIENGPWAGWTELGYVDETEDPWADVMPAALSHGAAAIVVRPSDHNHVTGQTGWYVPLGYDWCVRCGDTNYDETRQCITCTSGDVGYRDGQFREGWPGVASR